MTQYSTIVKKIRKAVNNDCIASHKFLLWGKTDIIFSRIKRTH